MKFIKIAIIVAITFCFAASASAGDTFLVAIQLDADSCPVATYPELLDLAEGDRVEWQSVDTEGFDVSKRYSILFDPFIGSTFTSRPSGFTRSTPLSRDLPDEEVVYKYTVVSDDDSGCPPLDPQIRTRR